jgi:pilus assembly protein Flp/PilA
LGHLSDVGTPRRAELSKGEMERQSRNKLNWSQTMFAKIKNFVANDSGATAIEYALIASLIAIALVTVLTSLGGKLSSEFSEVSSALK